MSNDNGGIFLKGRVLDAEHKSGTSNKTGTAWAFWIVSVLTGKTVSEVRWDEKQMGQGTKVPTEGDPIHLEVTLDVYAGRQQIEARRLVLAPATGARAAS